MLGKYSFGLDAGPAGTSCKGQRAPCNSALQRLPASPLLRNKRPWLLMRGLLDSSDGGWGGGHSFALLPLVPDASMLLPCLALRDVG